MPLEKKPAAKPGVSKPVGATKPTQGASKPTQGAGSGFKAASIPKKTTAVKKPPTTTGDKDAVKKKETGAKVAKEDKNLESIWEEHVGDMDIMSVIAVFTSRVFADFISLKQSVKKEIDQATQLIKEVKIEEKKADEMNIQLKQIAEVVFDDKEKQIETTKKWPLILDKNGNVEAFLRYRDVNFIDTFNPSNMEPDKLRLAILGGLRFGKELVVYTHDQLMPMWTILVERLSAIHSDLVKDIMSWKILEDDYYKNLLREEDGEMYSEMEFSKSQMYELNKKFKFVLLTNDEEIQTFKPDWLIVTVT